MGSYITCRICAQVNDRIRYRIVLGYGIWAIMRSSVFCSRRGAPYRYVTSCITSRLLYTFTLTSFCWFWPSSTSSYVPSTILPLFLSLSLLLTLSTRRLIRMLNLRRIKLLRDQMASPICVLYTINNIIIHFTIRTWRIKIYFTDIQIQVLLFLLIKILLIIIRELGFVYTLKKIFK